MGGSDISDGSTTREPAARERLYENLHRAILQAGRVPDGVPNIFRDVYPRSDRAQRSVFNVLALCLGMPNDRTARNSPDENRRRQLITKLIKPRGATFPQSPASLLVGIEVEKRIELAASEFEDAIEKIYPHIPLNVRAVRKAVHAIAEAEIRDLATHYQLRSDPGLFSSELREWIIQNGPALAIQARTGCRLDQPDVWQLGTPLQTLELMKVASSKLYWSDSEIGQLRDGGHGVGKRMSADKLLYSVWEGLGDLIEALSSDQGYRSIAEAIVVEADPDIRTGVVTFLKRHPDTLGRKVAGSLTQVVDALKRLPDEPLGRECLKSFGNRVANPLLQTMGNPDFVDIDSSLALEEMVVALAVAAVRRQEQFRVSLFGPSPILEISGPGVLS